MPKVQHPAFAEIIHDVAADELEGYLAAGWLALGPLTGERGPELARSPKDARAPKK